MSSSSSASSSSSSSSSSTSTGRGRKRKHGDTAIPQQGLADLQEIKNRRIATVGKKYAAKYSKTNLNKAKQIVDWLVDTKQTANLSSGKSEEPHSKGWWFNWSKVDRLADNVADFCSSKRRKLQDGTVANEACHNLGKYRTAVKHFMIKAGTVVNNNLDWQKMSQYDSSVNHFFGGIRKEEQQLKKEGKIPLKKGGGVFTRDFYKELSTRVLANNMPKAALLNHTAMHTAGRMGNVGDQATSHFAYMGDAIRIKFPITKTAKEGDGTVWLHFYGNPQHPELDINLAYGIHFLCLSAGPGTAGRIFPGGSSPQEIFRRCVKSLFTEDELKTRYGLDYKDLVNHSWRKTALSLLSMGSYAPPSKASLDYRAGHNQDWQSAYYKQVALGDQRTGRLFIGQEGTTDFAQLPAHFTDSTDAALQAALLTCFPWCSVETPNFKRCLMRFLAAVVHHSQWLQEKFPNHRVHDSALFQTTELLESLREELGDPSGTLLERSGVSEHFAGKSSFRTIEVIRYQLLASN